MKDISHIFSARLRQLRGDKSKSAFGRSLNVPNPSTYHNYENGRVPDSRTVQRIAQRCGVTVDWLLGLDDSDSESATSGQGCPEVAKGSAKTETPENIEDSQLRDRGVPKLQKGQGQVGCRYPERADMPGELMVLREKLAETAGRMDAVEATLAHMSSQLDTVVGLLGAALGDGIKTTRPREGERKAG